MRSSTKKVLVAPLDWGLGHATRCIPIIRALVREQAEVVLACEGLQKNLLELEFPSLRVIELPGYHIHYSRGRGQQAWYIISQIPKILIQIKRERRWLGLLAHTESLDAVISDNRYGLWHPRLPTVFLTHQLAIRSGLGRWADRIITGMHYRYIRRFSECWVPDYPQPPGLAGGLSHPDQLPAIPVRYIGPMSRLSAQAGAPGCYDVLVLLSGPEPQRSLWEQSLLDELSRFSGRALLVRGLPGEHRTLVTHQQGVDVHNHLPSAALQEAMACAQLVIARAGYSTIMDLAQMGKRSVLVPTPGQPEQEYLARLLMRENLALCVSQGDFCLQDAIDSAAQFSYAPMPTAAAEALRDPIRALLEKAGSASKKSGDPVPISLG